MDLTGKAKEDFSYKYNMSNFNEYSEVIQNALIIEWFDSVGICIYIHIIGGIISYHIEVENKNLLSKVGNRQKATKQAIIKANQIYNENNQRNNYPFKEW